MAKFDYISAQQDALDLINEFGSDTTIGEVTETYDPVEGVMFPGTISKAVVKAVELPPSTGISYFGDQFKEAQTRGAVRFFYIAAKDLDLDLAAGFIIFWDGRIWDVDGVTPLMPDGVSKIFYTLGCTKSNKSNDLLDLPETPSCKDGLALVTNDW